MDKTKKKICMITNWYPTPDNPYNGLFFKEQAFALEDEFDFTVIHYKEKKRDLVLQYIVRCLAGNTFHVKKIHEERNTIEYNIEVYYPFFLIIENKFYDFFQKHLKHRSIMGVGTFVSELYQKIKRKSLTRIFQQCFANEADVFYCIDAQKESHTIRCAAEALNKPYVVAEHAPFPWPGSVINNIEKDAIQAADLFLAISYDKIRQVLLQNVVPKKIALVGNLVDENCFSLTRGSNDERTFIIVAAHSFYKNYSLFIEIFDRLTEITKIPFKVMIVGYGSNKGYSQNVDVLEERIKNSKFAEHAEMIPAVSHDRIQEVYGRADAFVMTSIQEGMPVSALEAACCGLPIFSTMCGGVEDYVNDDIGRIYKIIDKESFANGLKDYLEGKITFNREYIRQYVIDRYGKKAFTDRMKKIFYEVIDGR